MEPDVKDYPYVLMHDGGCGDVAFYANRLIKPGDLADPNEVLLPNGTHPFGGRIRCGSCQEPFKPMLDKLILRGGL